MEISVYPDSAYLRRFSPSYGIPYWSGGEREEGNGKGERLEKSEIRDGTRAKKNRENAVLFLRVCSLKFCFISSSYNMFRILERRKIIIFLGTVFKYEYTVMCEL